jgi:hypothetical protein
MNIKLSKFSKIWIIGLADRHFERRGMAIKKYLDLCGQGGWMPDKNKGSATRRRGPC